MVGRNALHNKNPFKKLLKKNYASWPWGVKNIVEKAAYFFTMRILLLIFAVRMLIRRVSQSGSGEGSGRSSGSGSGRGRSGVASGLGPQLAGFKPLAQAVDLKVNNAGDLVAPHSLEEQIVKRDEHSWLIDGAAPIDDVMRSLDIHEFPEAENYETIAGFMMYTLRKIPKRTDSVNFAGYKFEVVDIDSYKIDQLLVTKLPTSSTNDD